MPHQNEGGAACDEGAFLHSVVSTVVLRVKREEGAEILSPSLQRVGMGILQMLYLLLLDLLLQKVVLLRAELLPKEVPQKVEVPRKDRRVVLPRKHRRAVLLPEEVPRAVLPRKVPRYREFRRTRRAI